MVESSLAANPTNQSISDQSATGNQKSSTKKGCVNTFYRYYKGKKLGPYYVRRWKVGRQLHKEYIKAKDVERVKAECKAHKEGKKEVNRWLTNTIANLNYIEKMCKWEDQGRVRPCDHAYVRRLQTEGWDIDGRPRTRRHVTREIKTIDGKQMIVKTVHEVDGTTRVFMVPFFVNQIKNWFTDPIEALNRIFENAWNAVHGPDKQKTQSQNLWLQPQF